MHGLIERDLFMQSECHLCDFQPKPHVYFIYVNLLEQKILKNEFAASL
jgi:hypothetical protein